VSESTFRSEGYNLPLSVGLFGNVTTAGWLYAMEAGITLNSMMKSRNSSSVAKRGSSFSFAFLIGIDGQYTAFP
jgi:hypothetical protein